MTRKDGAQMGFTDHDHDLVIAGITHVHSSGVSGTDIDMKLGFAIDNAGLSALLSDECIRASDVTSGLYDEAQVLLRRVSWDDPTIYKGIWAGTFGALEIKGESFTVELLGNSAALNPSVGRVFSRMCDAKFGDERCGLSLGDYPEGTQCTRSFTACKNLFSNSVNYRGFPYLIGDDAMQSGPPVGQILEGGSRYGTQFDAG